MGTLGALELGLRRWVETPSSQTLDASYGQRHVPHARVVYSREGYSVGMTNRIGLFDTDPMAAPARGRVLVLGDSYTQAKQVAEGQRFTEVAQRQLSGVDVMNAGHTGWAPPDAVPYLDQFPAELRPDAIVLQVGANDLNQLSRPGRARVVRGPNGMELVLPTYSRSSGILHRVVRKLTRSSALVYAVRQRISLLAEEERHRLRGRRASTDTHDAPTVSQQPSPTDLAKLELVLRRIGEHARTRVLFFVPDLRYGPDGAESVFDGARAGFEMAAHHAGWIFVDATEAAIGAYARTGQPLHGFHNAGEAMGRGHLNSGGHAVMGKVLADALDAALPPAGV